MKNTVKRFLIAGILVVTLSVGCLATKIILPGGEPLTTEESAQLKDIKDTVSEIAKHTNNVLIPGGGAGAIIAALATWYWRRRIGQWMKPGRS